MRCDGSKLLYVALMTIPLACGTPEDGDDDGGLLLSSGLDSETGSSGADGSGSADGSSGTSSDGATTATSDAGTGGTTDASTGTTTDASTSSTTDGGTTDTGTSTTGNPNPDNLPAWCDPTLDWNPQWAQWEEEVLVIMNQRRSEGANCGSEGSFPPAGPLTMQPNLRCAARMHSLDMYERDFFDHTNPDGDGPGERIGYSGYDAWGWGENIAWGYSSPAAVMQGWMDSDGHCSNIMNGSFTEVGVGWYTGDQWTQAFGTPAG